MPQLWTKICEIRQNFKDDLRRFCEIFLNIDHFGAPPIESTFFFLFFFFFNEEACENQNSV